MKFFNSKELCGVEAEMNRTIGRYSAQGGRIGCLGHRNLGISEYSLL